MQSQFVTSWNDFLEKGKGAQIGEIRTWNNGKKYQKTSQGWVEYRTHSDIGHRKETKFNGELVGSKEWGSPQFEPDLNISTSTEFQYTNADGSWKEERVEKVHKPIIESFVKRGKKNPQGQKTCTLMMGAPATGKGFLQKFLRSEGSLESHVVAIDPDDIKMHGLKPDWDRFSDQNKKASAGRVHEEGSYLAKEAFSAMEGNDFDYLQDKVFADYGKLMKEINRLAKKGYKVKIFMAKVPFELGYQRMLERAKKTGRSVPEGYMKKQYEMIDATWQKLMENMPDNVISANQYDNSQQGGPVLVDSYTKEN